MNPAKEEQALVRGTGGEPGINHPQHPVPMRKIVAENAGVSVADVTPQGEKTEETMNADTEAFLEEVAHVPQQEDQAAEFQQANTPNGLDNLMETVRANTPGMGDDLDTSRTALSGPQFGLEEARKEKMKPVEEAA